MHQFHFLIPDPASFPSGGNIYNDHLIHALIKAGMHVSHSTYHSDILMTSTDTLYILDSIFFEQIEKPDQQIPPGCIGLVHHLNSLYPLSEAYFQQKEKHILEQFAGFIVTSSFTSRYLSEHGFDPSRICIIEPAPTFHNEKKKSVSQKVHGFMLGSVIPRKGQLHFLQSLAAINVPPFYTLTIAGSMTADTGYAQQCAEMILSHKSLTNCVRLLGEQDPESIRRLYDTSNLFISASEMETFGMAIQDAVVCGLPVLALEGGYAAEHVLHRFNGHRCSTIEQLVDAFDLCITDTAHFVQLQQHARDFAPAYQAWDDGARKFIDAFA